MSEELEYYELTDDQYASLSDLAAEQGLSLDDCFNALILRHLLSPGKPSEAGKPSQAHGLSR